MDQQEFTFTDALSMASSGSSSCSSNHNHHNSVEASKSVKASYTNENSNISNNNADADADDDVKSMTLDTTITDALRIHSGRKFPCSFPLRLHCMLDDASSKGFEEIVSWTDDGKRFRIHQRRPFEKEVLPTYFSTSKYKSFTRQLNLYGFDRSSRGEDRGSYGHQSILRNQVELSHGMTRVRCKRKDTRISATAKKAADKKQPVVGASTEVSTTSTINPNNKHSITMMQNAASAHPTSLLDLQRNITNQEPSINSFGATANSTCGATARYNDHFAKTNTNIFTSDPVLQTNMLQHHHQTVLDRCTPPSNNGNDILSGVNANDDHINDLFGCFSGRRMGHLNEDAGFRSATQYMLTTSAPDIVEEIQRTFGSSSSSSYMF